MHEWLPMIAAIGIGVLVAARMEVNWLDGGFLCGGLCALFQYLGG